VEFKLKRVQDIIAALCERLSVVCETFALVQNLGQFEEYTMKMSENELFNRVVGDFFSLYYLL